MSNQRQEAKKSAISANDFKKALDKRNDPKPEASESHDTLAGVFDVNYTDSKKVQQYIKSKERLINCILFVLCPFLVLFFISIFNGNSIYQTVGLLLICVLLSNGIIKFQSAEESPQFNKEPFLKYVYLNDDDFKMISGLYCNAKKHKVKKLIGGILIICLAFTLGIPLVNTTLEISASDLMLLLLFVGIVIISKTLYQSYYLAKILKADDRNHQN